MNKKNFLAITSLIVLFSLSTAVGATDNIKVTLNNKEIQFDAEPFIEDGRTLVPIRAITEAMNFDVAWDAASSTAVIENENQSIYIQIGNKMIHSKDKSSLNEQKIQIGMLGC